MHLKSLLFLSHGSGVYCMEIMYAVCPPGESFDVGLRIYAQAMASSQAVKCRATQCADCNSPPACATFVSCQSTFRRNASQNRAIAIFRFKTKALLTDDCIFF